MTEIENLANMIYERVSKTGKPYYVYPNPEQTPIEETFYYTIGSTLLGLPEIVLTTYIAPKTAFGIIKHVQHHIGKHGFTPNVALEGVIEEGTIKLVELTQANASKERIVSLVYEKFHQKFSNAIPNQYQLMIPDQHFVLPDEEGYSSSEFPQPLWFKVNS